MAQKRQKSTAAKITPGLATGDGMNSEDAVDQSNNTWVVAVGPGGGPITVTSSGGASADPIAINQTNYFTMLDTQLRDIKKLLALILIEHGGVVPDEIADVFADDVAA